MSITRRSQAEWVALFESQTKQSLSNAEFCRQNKLCAKYFSKRKQDLGYKAQSLSTFSQLSISSKSDFIAPTLTLIHGQSKLIFSSQPSVEFMARLLMALHA